MIKRLRRHTITSCFAMCWMTTVVHAQPDGALGSPSVATFSVWRVQSANVDAADPQQLHNVRLISPTTYIVAESAKIGAGRIEAVGAKIYVNDWSINAAALTIDPTVDSVQITAPRTDAR